MKEKDQATGCIVLVVIFICLVFLRACTYERRDPTMNYKYDQYNEDPYWEDYANPAPH